MEAAEGVCEQVLLLCLMLLVLALVLLLVLLLGDCCIALLAAGPWSHFAGWPSVPGSLSAAAIGRAATAAAVISCQCLPVFCYAWRSRRRRFHRCLRRRRPSCCLAASRGILDALKQSAQPEPVWPAWVVEQGIWVPGVDLQGQVAEQGRELFGAGHASGPHHKQQAACQNLQNAT